MTNMFEDAGLCPSCGRSLGQVLEPASVPGKQPTSRLAALRVFPRTGRQRRKILELIARGASIGVDGATDEEICDVLSMNPNSVHPRRGELVTGGWIQNSGTFRETEGGDWAIVWIATPIAVQRLKEASNGST